MSAAAVVSTSIVDKKNSYFAIKIDIEYKNCNYAQFDVGRIRNSFFQRVSNTINIE